MTAPMRLVCAAALVCLAAGGGAGSYAAQIQAIYNEHNPEMLEALPVNLCC